MPVVDGILKGNSEKKVWQPGGPWKGAGNSSYAFPGVFVRIAI
jgi:hypothetical protein